MHFFPCHFKSPNFIFYISISFMISIFIIIIIQSTTYYDIIMIINCFIMCLYYIFMTIDRQYTNCFAQEYRSWMKRALIKILYKHIIHVEKNIKILYYYNNSTMIGTVLYFMWIKSTCIHNIILVLFNCVNVKHDKCRRTNSRCPAQWMTDFSRLSLITGKKVLVYNTYSCRYSIIIYIYL